MVNWSLPHKKWWSGQDDWFHHRYSETKNNGESGDSCERTLRKSKSGKI
ncbi:hypothetical protein PTHTG4_13520 [Parageobacillus thermoglucosidasius]|nr:hypothetical protein PTHTG4_13520 [Parageobacillus thermoglucosidasius]